MNYKDIRKIKSVFRKAIKIHLKKGGKLIDGGYVRENIPASLCACPVQVVIGSADNSLYGVVPKARALTKICGIEISRMQMAAITNGYDNILGSGFYPIKDHGTPGYAKLYRLGKELRKEFKPLTKVQEKKIQRDYYGKL